MWRHWNYIPAPYRHTPYTLYRLSPTSSSKDTDRECPSNEHFLSLLSLSKDSLFSLLNIPVNSNAMESNLFFFFQTSGVRVVITLRQIQFNNRFHDMARKLADNHAKLQRSKCRRSLILFLSINCMSYVCVGWTNTKIHLTLLSSIFDACCVLT